MKKLLLTLFIILFTCLNCGAVTTITHYNRAGVPVSIQHGHGAAMRTNAFGQAYSQNYRPHYRMRAGYNRGYYRYPYQNPRMYPPVPPAPIRRHTTVSTLDKNYNIQLPKKSHTIGGITYYN